MPRDLRVHSDPAYQAYLNTLVHRYQALTLDERKAISDSPPGDEQLEDTHLRDYAQAVRALQSVIKDHCDWSDILKLDEARNNSQVRTALHNMDLTPEQRGWLLRAAKAHLQGTPFSQWLWVPGRSEEQGGLVPIDTVSTPYLLEFWVRSSRADVANFTEGVGLALTVLERHDYAHFLCFVANLQEPVILKVIADRYSNDPELGLELSSSGYALVAALGTHHLLAYLEAVEAYGEELALQVDPYSDNVTAIEAALERRASVEHEISSLLEGLLSRLGGGSKHDQLLGELLAYGVSSSQRGRNVTKRKLLQAVAIKVARRFETDENSQGCVLVGLETDPRTGMAAVAAVTSHLKDAPDLAERWHLLLIQHLEQRLKLPTIKELEGPRSSETDKLRPGDGYVEALYITNTAASLKQLGLGNKLELVAWFKQQFEEQPLLGTRRERSLEQWHASVPRAALLMLIGAALLESAEIVADQEELTKLLGHELACRLEEWEWYKQVGFRAEWTSPLEHRAIVELAQTLPETALRAALNRCQSVWTSVCLAGQSITFQHLLEQRLESSLASNLLLLDKTFIVDLLCQLARINGWQAFSTTLARYRIMQPDLLMLDFFNALEFFHLGSQQEGLAQLEMAVNRLARPERRTIAQVEFYLSSRRAQSAASFTTSSLLVNKILYAMNYLALQTAAV